MAVKSSSVFHALKPRNSCFTLLHIFSIGFKSGLYPGKKSTRAPCSSIACCAADDLCARKLSMTTTSPLFQGRHKMLLHLCCKGAPVQRASKHQTFRGAIKANGGQHGHRFQRPSGAWSKHRSPTGARPYRRVLFAFAPLSSRNTKLARRFILHPAPLFKSLGNVRPFHLFTGLYRGVAKHFGHFFPRELP